MAVTIGFNASLNSGEFPVGQKFGPAPQVKECLRLLRWKFNLQRCHDRSLSLRSAVRQLAWKAWKALGSHDCTRAPGRRRWGKGGFDRDYARPASASSGHRSAPMRM